MSTEPKSFSKFTQKCRAQQKDAQQHVQGRKPQLRAGLLMVLPLVELQITRREINKRP